MPKRKGKDKKNENKSKMADSDKENSIDNIDGFIDELKNKEKEYEKPKPILPSKNDNNNNNNNQQKSIMNTFDNIMNIMAMGMMMNMQKQFAMNDMNNNNQNKINNNNHNNNQQPPQPPTVVATQPTIFGPGLESLLPSLSKYTEKK